MNRDFFEKNLLGNAIWHVLLSCLVYAVVLRASDDKISALLSAFLGVLIANFPLYIKMVIEVAKREDEALFGKTQESKLNRSQHRSTTASAITLIASFTGFSVTTNAYAWAAFILITCGAVIMARLNAKRINLSYAQATLIVVLQIASQNSIMFFLTKIIL